MSDAQFEDFIKRETRDYNAPPAVTPRDEMWEAIVAARGARYGAAAAPDIIAIGPRRPLKRVAPWIGMAATLLVGIGIGRFVMDDRTAPATVAERPESSTALPATSDTGAPATEIAAPQTETSLPSPLTNPTQQLAAAPRRNAPTTLPAALPAATRADGSSPSMRIASREHLERAEALVTIVASIPADAVMDSLTGIWAREMLGSTRLLLDSPAGDDPARRRLLEDLETVLVQLVQRSGTTAEERELLDRTLQRTQLLTRLRSGAAGI
ncbi:MAG: hypothetical protein KF689_10665 [Gemmatimonadaceae bacterium]|nr:hypothetical protein [Gemmatimonadaceae bacterium]MCW5825939.1 hypothetical protein [Gemmatimonadaceae bacterium]